MSVETIHEIRETLVKYAKKALEILENEKNEKATPQSEAHE